MGVPLFQQAKVASYILRQRIKGVKRYPLVLMLEPLFRCNLACAGCGKIDYPDEILNMRLSLQQCLESVDECPAPIVSIPGGEPLLHKEIGEIVEALVRRKRFVYLCTNALLLKKKMNLFTPSRYLTFSVHLDGEREEHDRSVCQEGVFDRAVEAIKIARDNGFRVNVNCTLFDNAKAAHVADFFDFSTSLGVEGITVSPGYAYERAPDQENFLKRSNTKQMFRDIFTLGKERKRAGKPAWPLCHSGLYLDFLAGNQQYHCTPWGNPTRNIFGWQRPCYLLGEGFAPSFKSLMEETEWERYGTGNYEKCANCMAHCGYEASAVEDALLNPFKALKVALFGVRTRGAMTEDISLAKARPAEYIFSRHVQEVMDQIHVNKKTKADAASQGGKKTIGNGSAQQSQSPGTVQAELN